MRINPDNFLFGENIRRLRKTKIHQSQEEFASLLKIDRSYISEIERGLRNPTLDVIVRLAHGLGVHPAELLKPLPRVPTSNTPGPAN